MKEAVFPFGKFPDSDPILGPEMKSTGEVMGTGRSFGEAYAKAQTASGVTIPTRGVCLISVRERDKPAAVDLAQLLIERGFEIVATHGTAAALDAAGVRCRRVNKVREGRPHIVDMIKNDEISLIVNTTEGKRAIHESNSIRREAVARKVTYYTTLAAALATCEAIDHLQEVEVNRLQDLHMESSGMTRKPLTLKGAERLRARAATPEDRGPAAGHPGDRGGARARRPERERRVSRGPEQQGFIEGRIKQLEHDLSHCEIIDVSRLPQGGQGRVRRHRAPRGPGRRFGGRLPDRRRARGRRAPGPDLDHLADRARADRQE